MENISVFSGNSASKWLALSSDIRQVGIEIASGPLIFTNLGLNDPKVVATLLAARSLGNFRAFVLLMDDALIVEARIMVRAIHENAFWIAGLLEGGTDFVEAMKEDHARGTKIVGELVLGSGVRIPDAAVDSLRKKLKKAGDQYPGASLLNPKTVASTGPLSGFYALYAQLSTDAAHPTLDALWRHIVREPDSALEIDLEPVTSSREFELSWSWATVGMLSVFAGLNQILGGVPGGERFRALSDRAVALAPGK